MMMFLNYIGIEMQFDYDEKRKDFEKAMDDHLYQKEKQKLENAVILRRWITTIMVLFSISLSYLTYKVSGFFIHSSLLSFLVSFSLNLGIGVMVAFFIFRVENE